MSGPDLPRPNVAALMGVLLNERGTKLKKQKLRELPVVTQLQFGLQPNLMQYIASDARGVATASTLQTPRQTRDDERIAIVGIGPVNQEGLLFSQGGLSPHMTVATAFPDESGADVYFSV